MNEYCIKCGKKLDATDDDTERGLCSICKLIDDNPFSEIITVNSTEVKEEKLDTIINQLDTIIDVLCEMRNRK